MSTDVDFTKGQSGGPLYGKFDDGQYYMVGVMTSLHPVYNKASGGPALTSLVSRAYANFHDDRMEKDEPKGDTITRTPTSPAPFTKKPYFLNYKTLHKSLKSLDRYPKMCDKNLKITLSDTRPLMPPLSSKQVQSTPW